MDPNQAQARGSVPSFNTHPRTGPTTLRKLLRAGVSNRLAVRTAGNAPSPSPRACFYGNFPRSAEAASLPGNKRSAPSRGPWSQGSPGPPGWVFLPRGPQPGKSPASMAWRDVAAAPKAWDHPPGIQIGPLSPPRGSWAG